ncbi:MAG: hypothetical protein A2149_09125 [Candidatus Schekmanbacteria bacterium RBG_16_38_11]|uniref:DUF4238 domain-containing protein n=1 Tax=Candidatus Schekmanbacteria bacterium RBG_16_38_11 TaxID=1817880 RepID=A0A1F7S1D2_9BACT|nr:MAG: hypothetical protein A2149_09125 [Candidatus Schekmanbacteria bacterium RBG_16_38_11]
MARKKRHHYIPKFYVEGFIDPQNKPFLWIYEKGRSNIIKASAKDIAVEKHYFSFLDSQGKRDSETLENALAEIEGKVASVFRKIFEEETLTEENRAFFASFLALMMTRVPNFRNNISIMLKSLIKKMSLTLASHKNGFEGAIKRFERDTGNKIDMPIEDLRQFLLDENRYEIKSNPQFSVAMALSNLDKLTQVFFDMKWSFIKATDDYKFLSGDNPLYYYDPTHDPRSFFGVGLLNKNIEVTLPLSRDVALFASWQGKSRYFQGINTHVKSINKRTILAASRFVFASLKSDIINKLVQKCVESAPIMRVG